MLDPIETLIRWCAPWQTFYGDSRLTEIAVTSVHVVAMLLGGGFAVAADRLTLRTTRRDTADRMAMLDELQSVHRPVMVGLAALFASGVALAASDVETFAASPAFLVKLALVVLLSVNGPSCFAPKGGSASIRPRGRAGARCAS
ncbi:MAG: hypothetical protein IPP98_10195 [Gemmatimonadetes bacterium]|nr:hypothetical protein [Gemmatimonadota bacterium]